MLAETIIANFDTYTDDMSELSSVQKYALLNKKYREVSNWSEWEWLREIGSVVIAANAIPLPANFKRLAEEFETIGGGAYDGFRFFFWIGNIAYPIINMKDRRRYDTQAYLDVKNSKIVLQDLTVSGTAEFDMYGSVTDIAAGESPVFDSDYHPVLYHMMAIDHEIIDQSEKARSLRAENEVAIDGYRKDMEYDNAGNQEDFQQ